MSERTCIVCGAPAFGQVRDVFETYSDGPYRTFEPGKETRGFCKEHSGHPLAQSRTYKL